MLNIPSATNIKNIIEIIIQTAICSQFGVNANVPGIALLQSSQTVYVLVIMVSPLSVPNCFFGHAVSSINSDCEI